MLQEHFEKGNQIDRQGNPLVRKPRSGNLLHRTPPCIWHCGVHREREVVLMLIPSWAKFKEPLKVSEASLRAIRARERERLLAEEADKRHARRKARMNLIIKPQ